jgi:hypothetical protein
MKKILLSGFVLAALIACNNPKATTAEERTTTESTVNTQTANTAVSTTGAPVIKFEKDVYDFGKITEGEKVSYDFTFTNTGGTPLIISDASATCGCTVPEVPKEPVAPGASAKIKVVFSSAGKVGLQDKVVTVTANTIPAQTQLHVIGEVVK